MAPEQRAERIEELQGAIRRQWLLFALTEAAVIFGPLAVFLAVYLMSDAVSDKALNSAVGVLVVADIAFVLYWVFRRIMPIGRQLSALGVEPFENG